MKSKNSFPQSNETMESERIDELERYYKPIGLLDKWDSRIFWFSAILSVVVLYENQIPWKQIQELPAIIFIISVIIHLILSLYIRFNLFPIAERKRRRQLLSDSFSVPLTSEKTQKYYNNDLQPSVARLATNVLENTLFAKTISSKMAIRERVNILIYFVVWILAVYWRSTDLGLLVIITQTLFSSEIIEKWLRLEILQRENEDYYDELYHEFLHKIDFNSPSGLASALDIFASYETTKGMSGVSLSSSIFSEINPTLSLEWDSIRKKLGIQQNDNNT